MMRAYFDDVILIIAVLGILFNNFTLPIIHYLTYTNCSAMQRLKKGIQ